MSELKAYRVKGVTFGDTHDVYLKSEADEVIAELKHQRDGALGLTNSGLTLEDLNHIARKEIDRQKYKRCLAMAETCQARYDDEDAKVNGHGASWEYKSKEMKYWERWHTRWLAIAEKFKED